ncbi:hypothetical protein BC826DRAFT_969450 [Russula brevipes]|nr:hypothetical protein BC826DRAFT_969450 [Russula brevipes]
MSLSLLSSQVTIVCDGKVMVTHTVKQEGTSVLTAFIASEAGKQFKVVMKNNAVDFDITSMLYIDGEYVQHLVVPAGRDHEVIGLRASAFTIRPFKFQDVKLVDPDVEDAPMVPEMGTIEVQMFRSRTLTMGYHSRQKDFPQALHLGRVSELSKKAGWHRVGLSSTADEIPIPESQVCSVSYIDPPGVRYATFKIFYRPRGRPAIMSYDPADSPPELLEAQGIIPRHGLGARDGEGSEASRKRRTREDELPTPPAKRPVHSIKKEKEIHSSDARAQQIRDLQAKLDALVAEQASPTVKREPRCGAGSPSPIRVGQAASDVIDLTLEG